MKIKKKFYHGTCPQAFYKIILAGEIIKGGSCATDDFHYAKNYAIQKTGFGVVLMFRRDVEMKLIEWIKYWFNRFIMRKLSKFINNETFTNWYIEKFTPWGFVENAMELMLDGVPLSKIEKVTVVEGDKHSRIEQ